MIKHLSVAVAAFWLAFAGPALAQYSNDAVTGSSGGGSGTVTSVATGCGSTGGPITTTGTISAALTARTNATTSDPVVSTDCGNVVYENNVGAITVGIAQAGTTGFAAGTFFEVCNIGAGTATITPTTSTIGGASTKAVAAGSAASPSCVGFQSDGTNYNIVAIPAGGAGTVTTTGSPASGNLAKFSGTTSVTNGDLSGDCTTTGTLAINCTKTAGTAFSALATTAPGTGVATAAANALSAAGGLTTTIASGATAMGTGAISSATCATVVTATATNTATTDVLTASFNGDPHAVTGYIPATTGMLTIIAYPTANTANFLVCNNTSASITPGAITLNWRVVR